MYLAVNGLRKYVKSHYFQSASKRDTLCRQMHMLGMKSGGCKGAKLNPHGRLSEKCGFLDGSAKMQKDWQNLVLWTRSLRPLPQTVPLPRFADVLNIPAHAPKPEINRLASTAQLRHHP